MIRLSQAWARMRLASDVTPHDVDTVSELMQVTWLYTSPCVWAHDQKLVLAMPRQKQAVCNKAMGCRQAPDSPGIPDPHCSNMAQCIYAASLSSS